MHTASLLYPIFALVLLSFVVWLRLFFERTSQMRVLKVRPQQVAGSAQVAALLPISKAADNFRNLFELPVLFYVLCLLLIVTQQPDASFVYAAWLFVASRCVHSLIHLSYNQVMHRFYAYLVGAIVLALMWCNFAWRTVQGAQGG